MSSGSGAVITKKKDGTMKKHITKASVNSNSRPNQAKSLTRSNIQKTRMEHQQPKEQSTNALAKPAYKLSTYETTKDASALFGSLPSQLFLKVNDILDASLVDGVSSLPFLPTSQQTVKFSLKNISQFLGVSGMNREEEKDASAEDVVEEEAGDYKLLKSLRFSYAKNIDKAEIYALRNIFSIEELPRSKRIQLLQAIQANVDVEELDATLNDNTSDSHQEEEQNDMEEIMESKKDEPSLLTVPKSIDEVPTELDMTNVEKEIEKLRMQVLEKRQRRNILASQLGEIKQVANTVKVAKNSIHSSMRKATGSNTDEMNENGEKNMSSRTIQDVVSSAMIGKKGLEQLQQQGTYLLDRLDEIKKNTGTNDDDYLNEFLLKVKKKRNQVSLDDHFAAMKERLSGISNTDMEGALGNLRKKKKTNI